eukprot:789632-Prymnesium_polylepis.1
MRDKLQMSSGDRGVESHHSGPKLDRAHLFLGADDADVLGVLDRRERLPKARSLLARTPRHLVGVVGRRRI